MDALYRLYTIPVKKGVKYYMSSNETKVDRLNIQYITIGFGWQNVYSNVDFQDHLF